MKSKRFFNMDSLPSGHASERLIEGCAVLEGGAFRAIYGEGVLDYLMEQDINLSCAIGVSAGALNGLNYVSGQIGRSVRTNLAYRHNSRYVGFKAMVHSGSPLNIDFLLKDMNEKDPLDEERFYRKEQRFIAVATDCDTVETVYFEKGKCEDIMQAIKASASLPYLSRMIKVGDRRCLDGGITCNIPYRWALEEGYEKIVLVLTREKGFRNELKDDAPRTGERIYRRHKQFGASIDDLPRRYNEEMDEIDALEEEGRVFCIRPSQPVDVARVESDINKLSALYYLGYHDAMRRMDALKAYLGVDK